MAHAIPSTCATNMAMAGQTQGDNPAPCKDMSHGCQDMLGCVTAVSFAMVDSSTAFYTVTFSVVARHLSADQLLEGRSIAPDLPVPILPA